MPGSSSPSWVRQICGAFPFPRGRATFALLRASDLTWLVLVFSLAAHAQSLPSPADIEAARVAARALPGTEALLAQVEPHTGPGGEPAVAFVSEFTSRTDRLKTR